MAQAAPPIVPRLASMPNAPLHSTYAQPPDGIRGSRCLGNLWMAERKSRNKSIAGKPAPTVCSALSQTTRNAPSGGRVESLWKGASRMDAARGVKGQGRPFTPAPGAMMERGNGAKRSNSRRLARRVSEANQVERSETRMQGARPFAYFWRGRPSGRLPKVSRHKDETQRSGVTAVGWPAGRAQRVNR